MKIKDYRQRPGGNEVLESRSNYFPGIDILRIISAVCIVVYHTPGSPGRSVTVAGLAYFVLVAFYFQARSACDVVQFSLRQRASRILVPWLVWSSIYGAIKLHFAGSFAEWLGYFSFRDLLIGPAVHLWFLSYVFVGSLVSNGLLLFLVHFSLHCRIFLLLVIASLLCVIAKNGSLCPWPFMQWLHCSPLLPVGLAAGQMRTMSQPVRAAYYIPVMVLFYFNCPKFVPLWHVIGIVAFILSIEKAPTQVIFRLRYAAGLTMGVYLIHPIFFYVMHRFVPLASWQAIAAVATVGSFLAAALLSMSRRVAKIMFGPAS